MPENALTDYDIMAFGKHKGKPLKDIPADYLLWLWDNGVHREPHPHRNGGLHLYIKENLSSLEQDAPDVIVKNRP